MTVMSDRPTFQVCKEEEEAIRVDLHEGCGRTKLFWLLALADKATLQALVEFRDVASNPTDLSAPVAQANVQLARVGVCRYCGMVSNDGLLAIGNVCANDECQVRPRRRRNVRFEYEIPTRTVAVLNYSTSELSIDRSSFLFWNIVRSFPVRFLFNRVGFETVSFSPVERLFSFRPYSTQPPEFPAVFMQTVPFVSSLLNGTHTYFPLCFHAVRREVTPLLRVLSRRALLLYHLTYIFRPLTFSL